MADASPTALTDLLHAVRARYRLVHVDETQSVLLLYVERLLRAAGCDVLRLRHGVSLAELVVAVRPARPESAPELIVAMEYAGSGSAARLLTIGADLAATDLWELGWDRVPPAERTDRDTADPEKTLPITVQPAILRRSLREAVYAEGQAAMGRALRLLTKSWEAEPESGCYIDLLLRGNDSDLRPDPRPAPAEQVLRRWLDFRAAPRSQHHGQPSTGTPRSRSSENERPVFLLIGAPGSGKSTLLRHLAVTLAREHLAEVSAGAALPGVRAPVLCKPQQQRSGPGPGNGPGPLSPDDPPDLDRLLDGAVPGMTGKMLRLWAELGLCVILLDGPVPPVTIARLQRQPTLVGGFPPKMVLCASARYFVQGREAGVRATHLIDEAVRSGWDLGYLEPLDDERLQHYLGLRIPDPMARSAAMAQLARSDNLRRLCRRPGLLAALCGGDGQKVLLGAGVAEGVPAPPLAELHGVLRPTWLEGVAGDRRIERTAREAVARVLARRLLSDHGDAVPWWDLVLDAGAEVPTEPDGARLLLHVVRALDDTMFLVEYEGEHEVPRLRFALSSAADYFTGEDVATRITTLSVASVSLCLQRGHSGRVRAVALSESGRLCLTGADDGTVRLWEAGSGFLLRVLSGHHDPVTAVLFACDDRLAVSASLDLTVRVWDVRTGECVRTLVGHTGGVTCLSYAPGKDLLCSGAQDGTVRLWQLSLLPGRCLQTLTPPGTGISAVSLSPDGLLCAVASAGPLVHIYHALSGERLFAQGGHGGPVCCVALSPDGRLCASGGEDLSIRLTEVRTGRLLQSLLVHEQAVTALSFSADGHRLASGSRDQSVRIFSVPAPAENTPARLLHCRKEQRGPVHSLTFVPPAGPPCGPRTGSAADAHPGPSARLLAVGTEGGALLWDAIEGQALRALDGTACGSVSESALQVGCLAASPDGGLLCTGSSDGGVRLWDMTQGRLLRDLRGHEGGILAVAFSPDGLTLATASEDQSVCLWDRQTGEEVDRFEGHFSDVRALSFSPDGYLLATGSDDQTVRVREAAGGMTLRTFSHSAPVTQVTFLPDGRHLLSASADGKIRLWETAGGPPVQTLCRHLGRVAALSVSPDGKLLASGGDDHLVRIWDARTGRSMHALSGHMDGVTAVAFSPDGRTLASTGLDRTVRLWEARSGRSLQTLRTGTGWLRALCFLPDGRLVTGGLDGVTVWQVPAGRVLSQLLALGEGWLALCPVLPEGTTPRHALYAAEPESPAALRMTDQLTSYPVSGWARLCHRPHLIKQALSGRPVPSLLSLQDDLRAAPVPMPILESSGSKATATALPQAVFIAEDRQGKSSSSSYTRLITADELLSSETQVRGELNRGEVEPLSPTTYAPGRISGRLHAYLVMHVFGRNLGDLPSSDTGYLLQRNPDVVRAPDVSFVSRERVPQGGTSGFFTGAPDLAAEVISPSNEWEVVERKAQEYLSTGSRVVWVLDPQTRTVHVHESPVRVRILGEADQLTGGTVLPGFAISVRELFG